MRRHAKDCSTSERSTSSPSASSSPYSPSAMLGSQSQVVWMEGCPAMGSAMPRPRPRDALRSSLEGQVYGPGSDGGPAMSG